MKNSANREPACFERLGTLLTLLQTPGVDKAEPPDKCRQRQALAHQCDQYNDEGHAENQIALRKGCPIFRQQRNCERRSQRNDASHAGERQYKWPLPWRRWIAPSERRD